VSFRIASLLAFIPLDRVINLAAMDWHFGGCFYSEANLIATDFDDHDFDVVADADLFINVAAKNEHN
jgi:hypothetical protein